MLITPLNHAVLAYTVSFELDILLIYTKNCLKGDQQLCQGLIFS